MSHTAPDFGFDSKEVNKWVASFGIPASTARNHTSVLIAEVKDKLREAARPLFSAGTSYRKASAELQVGERVMQTVFEEFRADSAAKSPLDETLQTPEDCPFDEDELDTTPAYNPADDDELKFKSDKVTTIPQTEAFKNELSRHALTTIAAENERAAQSTQDEGDDRPSDAELAQWWLD